MQDTSLLQKLNKVRTIRFLKFLDEQAEKEAAAYEKFYDEYQRFLKEGVVTDFTHKEALGKLLRFESSTLDKARGQDMGNTMRPTHRLHFLLWAGRMLAHVGRRPECASIRRPQLAQQNSRQIHGPFARGQPLESDLAAHHRLAHKTQAALPPDLAIAAHAALLPSCRILHLRHALGPITPAWLIMLRRSFLLQRLVRSFLIVKLPPTIQRS